jgi:hypothetical protein
MFLCKKIESQSFKNEYRSFFIIFLSFAIDTSLQVCYTEDKSPQKEARYATQNHPRATPRAHQGVAKDR